MNEEKTLALTRVMELLREAMDELGPEFFGLREDIGWIADEVRDLMSEGD